MVETEVLRIKHFKKLKEKRDKKLMMGASFIGMSGYRLCTMGYRKYAPLIVARKAS
jgi:hypothetical protein